MASSSLLTKILADFLSGFYLLNYVLKHATNLIQNRGSRCRYRVRTCTHQDAPDTRSSPTTGFVHHAQLTKFTTFINVGDELQVHRLQHQHIANWGAMMATRGAAPHSPYTNPVGNNVRKPIMRKKLKIGIIFLIGILIQSCDPTYPVLIKNDSGTEIIVDAKLTNDFYPGLTTTYIADENNRLQFKVESGKEFQCGMTIGGLKDDLPFTDLKIYTNKDTIIATNRNEVLNLFDKNWIGNLKTPYTLTVK